ncbi:TPA: hypothetical protein I7234_19905 [Vibrio vulnificus]|nr:hypothetical protein [Vibrio vulnificus]HAS6368368.1 hypothetical protein [Vibrio vulnificus]HDY7612171.1 hypothetical protein [Vibrio vulnificus]
MKNRRNRLHFNVAEELCVYYEQRHYTINLLNNISYAIFILKVPVHLNLSNCPSISASALVMLFAEVSRARMAKEQDDIVTIDFPQIRDLPWLYAMSVSYREYGDLFDKDHVFQTVNDPGKAMASILKLLHKSGVQLSKPDSRLFTRGVNEAMLNVINHAYIDQDDPLGGIGRRWWQACWVSEQNGEKVLVYIIYDLGCGILGSLPKSHPKELVTEHITRAMSYGVSRTNESDRGKGTQNMEEATEIRTDSLLFIGTNTVAYIKAEGQDATTQINLLPFTGTLVEWQIKL